jgi:ketosteroid isomerase-like protein
MPGQGTVSLSRRTHRRDRVVGLLALLVLAGTGGCGGQSDADQVRSAYADVIEAIVDGDGDAACKHMAGPAQRVLVEQATLTGARTCSDAIKAIGGLLGPEERAAYRDAKIGQVDVRGDRAEIPDSSLTGSEGGERLPRDENPAPVVFEKIDGTWLITSLG